MEGKQSMDRFMHRFRHRFGRRLGDRLKLRFEPRIRDRFRPEEKQLTLARMQTGQSCVVVEIMGGRRMIDRLSALGIRPGLIVTKVGSMFLRGPVTVQVGNTQVAVGFGMANRIIVEPRES